MKPIQMAFLRWTVALLLTVLTACRVTSLNPFYLDEEVVFDPALLGSWIPEKEAAEAGKEPAAKQESFTFECLPNRGYRVTSGVAGTLNLEEYEAHLFQVQDQRYLDVVRTRLRGSDGDDLSIPAHEVLKVVRAGSGLQFKMLSEDWLKESLEVEPKAFRHLRIPASRRSSDAKSERIVLTGDTRELQGLIRKAEAANAFHQEATGVLHRRP